MNIQQILDEIINDSEKADIEHIHLLLRKKASEYPPPENNLLKKLSDALSLHYNRGNTKQPYQPYAIFQDKRSADISDFSKEDLIAFQETVEKITNSNIKARLLDILWLRERNIIFAKQAIDEYIISAKKILDYNHWVTFAEKIERAIELALLIRRKEKNIFESITTYIKTLITEDDPLYLSARLMEILQKYDRNDAEKFYKISNSLAKKGDFTQAENYLNICVEWARILKNDELISESLSNLAELYVDQSNTLNENNALLSAHWLQKAIEIYKSIPNSREKRDELYKQLLIYQKESLKYMQKITTPIDLTEIINLTLSILEPLSFDHSLIGLAYHITSTPSYEKIEKTAKKSIEEHPISKLFGAVHLDGEGRVIATTPSAMNSNAEEYSKVLDTEILRLSQMEHSYIAMGSIEPAREYLYNKFNIAEEDFLKICSYNPFIQAGQEYLYAKGLYAGFCGDYITSTNLLSPLIENSLRYVLSQHGIEISSINTHGIQEVMLLKAILSHEKTLEIFGNDIIMDLKGILLERKYGNLRNIVAHGLGTISFYQQTVVVYFWWLVLRLCLVQTINQQKQNK